MLEPALPEVEDVELPTDSGDGTPRILGTDTELVEFETFPPLLGRSPVSASPVVKTGWPIVLTVAFATAA
jgi:hypothetical protein